MDKTFTLPLFVTLLFHGLILAVLIIEAPDAQPLVKRAMTSYIPAQLITMDPPKTPKSSQPSPPKRAAPKPKPDNVERAKALAKKQAEKKRRAEETEKKRLAEQKAKQEKDKKEQAKREREQEQQRLREQSEREFADAIARENAEQQALSDTQMANSYIALITEVIQRNWSRPPSARNNMEVELALQLVPTGEVVSVVVVRSSGNAAFDRSAENAVLKAERFPELKQLPPRVFEQYFRRLRLLFRPEDLRL